MIIRVLANELLAIQLQLIIFRAMEDVSTFDYSQKMKGTSGLLGFFLAYSPQDGGGRNF